MRCIESLKVWGSRPSHCVLTLIIYLDMCPEQLVRGPIRQFMRSAQHASLKMHVEMNVELITRYEKTKELIWTNY